MKTVTKCETPAEIPVWQKEPSDIVKFSITRSEWEALLGAVVRGATRGNSDDRAKGWEALEVLKTCIEEFDVSRLRSALRKIEEITHHSTTGDMGLINAIAKNHVPAKAGEDAR